MRKIITLDDHLGGEQTMQAAVLVGRNGRPLREQFSKTASEASEYIKAVEPKPNSTIVLVLALGVGLVVTPRASVCADAGELCTETVPLPSYATTL